MCVDETALLVQRFLVIITVLIVPRRKYFVPRLLLHVYVTRLHALIITLAQFSCVFINKEFYFKNCASVISVGFSEKLQSVSRKSEPPQTF